MLSKAAFGLAIVLATVSGSLAASHGNKSNGYSPNYSSAPTFQPSPPTIFGWPVDEWLQYHRYRSEHPF